MSEWDPDTITYAGQRRRVNGGDDDEFDRDDPDASLLPSMARKLYRDFVRNYRDGSSAVFLYRDQLLRRHTRGEHTLDVELSHVGAFDERLMEALQNQPNSHLLLFEQGAREALKLAIHFGESLVGPNGIDGAIDNNNATTTNNDNDDPDAAITISLADVPEIQIILRSHQTPIPMRSLVSTDINRLLLVPGIIISASRVRPRAVLACVKCTVCQNQRSYKLEGDGSATAIPKDCEPCKEARRESKGGGGALGVGKGGKKDTLVLMADQCRFVDSQQLKLQEVPEAVPTGEMPRSMMLIVDRELVDHVSPGTRVAVMGISSVFSAAQGGASTSTGKTGRSVVKTPYLRVVGIQTMVEGAGRGADNRFTREEEEEFLRLSRLPDVYQRLHKSIAPSISGSYTDDIKKAIACLLFGGTRRKLPDNVTLRGDINVLLLGDPSTAKSQFLKFVEKVAPVGVYTSGKGSSAAGLTASVIRDGHGEFFLEGGAMVLADGGVVCIDEFDKMREQDRVAIHEAMEQQTISVAKAGITTILNSRTSVLAAANPVYGTYDDTKSAAENIDFMPTILSRFDAIFIVRDVRDEEKDKQIANHVLGIHLGYRPKQPGTSSIGGGGGGTTATKRLFGGDENSGNDGSHSRGGPGNDGEFDLVTMKRYISFCRTRCAPVLSAQAADMLQNHYVGIREDNRKRGMEHGATAGMKTTASTVPITVRQLEAIIRISESLAKMEMKPEATTYHVTEAIRLFKVSTLNAAQAGAHMGDLSSLGNDQAKEVRRVEDQIGRRVGVGSVVSSKKLLEDFVTKHGFSVFAVQKAMQVMIGRGELVHLNQQRSVKRVR